VNSAKSKPRFIFRISRFLIQAVVVSSISSLLSSEHTPASEKKSSVAIDDEGKKGAKSFVEIRHDPRCLNCRKNIRDNDAERNPVFT
jgi:hypothetical protein